MPRFLGLVLALLVAALSFALTPGQALANHVGCGDVITYDTTLDSDLVGCAGTALTIGADDVTLDLAGHRVGDCCYPETTGIDNEGHEGVVIENGQVLGVTGIRLVSAHETVMRHLNVYGPFAISLTHSTENRLEASIVGTSYVAVSMEDSDHNVIRRSTINGYYHGVHLAAGSDHNRVEDSLLSAERYGPAIRVDASSFNSFRRNRLRSTFTGIALTDARGNEVIETSGFVEQEGILLRRSDANVIEGNELGAGACKICLSDSDDNVIRANDLASRRSYSELGITVAGSGNRIERNQAAAMYDGISIGAGAKNAVIRNVARGSDGNGIVIGSQASDTLVSRNDASRNGGNGIDVAGQAIDTLLSRNRANRNGADGILVGDATAVLSHNIANYNVGFGIEAVPGVIDGGGNRAFGNGNPVQCLNVVCK
jgi:parallel beta-helix repeat protein